MPHGKPAGIPCIQLLPDYRCALFGQPERPAVCIGLRPSPSMCGATQDEALAHLTALEHATAPQSLLVPAPGIQTVRVHPELPTQGGTSGDR